MCPATHLSSQLLYSKTILVDNTLRLPSTTKLAEMRSNHYLASFVLLHALVACAGEGTDVDPASLTLHATEKKAWSMRISVPFGSDFLIRC